MKIRLYFAVLLGLSLMFAACKKESSPVDPGPAGGDSGNYFPDNNGAYYKYNFEYEDDSTGASYSGERVTRYTGTSNIGGTNYTQQTDTFYTDMNAVSVSYFRKTDTGVFYFVDTTGLGEIIPDTIMQFIAIDAEMRAMKFPLEGTWPVYNLSLFTINLIRVSAVEEGTENVVINLVTGNVNREAVRIKYILTMNLPTDPDDPLGSLEEQNFEAFAWVVGGIGIVRWQGSAAVIGAFTGGGIDIDESSATITQNLIDYRL
jgi:hypothetical protein